MTARYSLVESRGCMAHAQESCSVGLEAKEPSKAKYDNSAGKTTVYYSIPGSSD